MARSDDRSRRTLVVVGRVCKLLSELGLDSALIGAMACAYHGYARATEDVDLAVCSDPIRKLPDVVRALENAGYSASFERPDAEDPLGGVITVTGEDFDTVQIVNFLNPLSGADNPGWDAIREARPVAPNREPRVVSLPHLVALKLYAGGIKNRLDVIELLERNAPVDIGAIRSICRKFELEGALEEILRELRFD